MTLRIASILPLPRIFDDRGNLSFIEAQRHIPFKIARVYWIYDVPGGEKRGGHAFRNGEEFLIALSGSFDVEVENGQEVKRYPLNRSYMGLYIPALHWRTLDNFSTNSLCLVLASTPYEEADYLYEATEWKLLAASNEVSPIPANEKMNAPIAPVVSIIPDMKKRPTVDDCLLMELPKVKDRAGNLTSVHSDMEIPFEINRVFYIYDVPGGEDRGAHAHRECHQFIIAASGAFEVELRDGVNTRKVLLNRPYNGLYVPPGIWAQEQGFSSGTVCLVFASHDYEESDYIRDFSAYKAYIHENR